MSIDPKVFNKKYYYDVCLGSEEFRKSGGLTLHPKVKKMIDNIGITRNMRVLEIGCGRGDTAMYVAKKAQSIIATDYSPAAIAIANKIRKKYPERVRDKVTFQVKNATQLNFKANSFDLILLIDTIDHLTGREQEVLFKNMVRMLSNKGTLFVRTCSNKILLSYVYPHYTYYINKIVTRIDKMVKGISYASLPKDPRTRDEKIQHINESDYFRLQRLFTKYSFRGPIKGETGLIKEGKGLRTTFYNFIIGYHPFSQHYPLNILFANSFICQLKLYKDTV